MTNSTTYPYRALWTLKELFANIAGLMTARRNLQTGGWNLLVSAHEAELDEDGGAYATVCDDHGTICNHTSKRTALRFLPYATEWCDECREVFEGRVTALADISRRNREDR